MTELYLKPCPFCGHSDVELWEPDEDVGHEYWSIHCPNCDFNSDGYGEAEFVVEKWNRRTDKPEE